MIEGYISHPQEVPLSLEILETGTCPPIPPRTIRGGILLETTRPVESGDLVLVTTGTASRRLSYRARVFRVEGLQGGRRRLILVFDTRQDAFRARMTEQICHIEAFRLACARQGERLSESEAARRWIERHSQDFPQIGPLVAEDLRQTSAA